MGTMPGIKYLYNIKNDASIFIGTLDCLRHFCSYGGCNKLFVC